MRNWYSTTTSKVEEDTRTSEKPQAHHFARKNPENTVENLHEQGRRQDQQTSVPITAHAENLEAPPM